MTAPLDLCLRGGTLLLPEKGLVEADLLIDQGRVCGVLARNAPVVVKEVVDIPYLTVLPGAIDSHIHLGHGSDISRPREAGVARAESAAAAKGGVTTFISYVLSTDDYSDLFGSLKDIVEAGSCVDFGLHFVLATKQHLARIGYYVKELGVPTLKLFMNSRGNEGQRLGLPPLDDGFLFEALEEISKHGGMLCPHPENPEIGWVFRDRLLASDPTGRGVLATWNAVKPPLVEAESVRRVCYLASQTDTPVYTVHISGEEPLKAAVEARKSGGDVSIETCIHYLTLDLETGADERAKVNPPIRPRRDRDALWAGIVSGAIDTVGTDHIHRPRSAKDGNIWKASPGFPGMETFIPALLTEGRRRGVSLDRLSELVSRNPARIMGLGSKKGAIFVGADADVAVVDLNSPWTFTQDDVTSSAGYCVMDKQQFDVRVVHTFVRGRHVMREMKIDPSVIGTGRFIPRQIARGKPGEPTQGAWNRNSGESR